MQDSFLEDIYQQKEKIKNLFPDDSYSYPQYVEEENQQDQQDHDNVITEKLDFIPGKCVPEKKSKNEETQRMIENIFKKIKKSKNEETQRIEVQMLPGESKNIPKNFTRALKHFIITNFSSNTLQNPEIKKFLSIQSKKACKQTLENSLKNSEQLRQISQMFFGQFEWASIFLEENKVDVAQYFRFNQIWFKSNKN